MRCEREPACLPYTSSSSAVITLPLRTYAAPCLASHCCFGCLHATHTMARYLSCAVLLLALALCHSAYSAPLPARRTLQQGQDFTTADLDTCAEAAAFLSGSQCVDGTGLNTANQCPRSPFLCQCAGGQGGNVDVRSSCGADFLYCDNGSTNLDGAGAVTVKCFNAAGAEVSEVSRHCIWPLQLHHRIRRALLTTELPHIGMPSCRRSSSHPVLLLTSDYRQCSSQAHHGDSLAIKLMDIDTESTMPAASVACAMHPDALETVGLRMTLLLLAYCQQASDSLHWSADQSLPGHVIQSDISSVAQMLYISYRDRSGMAGR